MPGDLLRIGDHDVIELESRLILGTGKYASPDLMVRALAASGTRMVTVALRRVDLKDASQANFVNHIDRRRYRILPNTAGCFTADEALRTARLAREALDTKLIKLEVIGSAKHLFPDNRALLSATGELAREGFVVLPYCLDDPVLCRQLEEAGAAAVMPLAAPIGSGLGLRNPHNLALILEDVHVPVIVDAGVGTASDAAEVMELGAAGVLMNTAVAGAREPERMARAMGLAVEAGRLAFQAGRIERRLYATASSPLTGLIG